MESSVSSADHPRIWHIYWQAAVGRDLTCDSALIHRCRSRLLGAHQAAGRTLLYYLLTPTEVHVLTVLGPGETPGDLARGVANVMARWVREVQGSPGPVFAGPYQARPVAGFDELRHEVRMLAWRPVSLRLCVAATHYRHSALRIALGLSRADGFHATALLGIFGDSVLAARHAFRTLLSRRPSPPQVLQWELAHGITMAPGSAGPMGAVARRVRGAAAALVAGGESRSVEGALALLERWVQTKLGLHAVHGLEQHKGAEGARGRAMVAHLALRSGLCSAASVARRFGRAKATLSEQMAACRRRPADQQIVSIPLDQLVREAIALAPSESGRSPTPRA